MRIMMISSEAVPYSKSGGLGDVASSLSYALGELGHDVRLVIPNYGLTDDTQFETLPFSAKVKIGHKTETINFKEKSDGPVKIYLIDHIWFSGRQGIYGDSAYAPYNDNLVRFTLLTKGALELCKNLKWTPEIFHGHDWTSGFLPQLVKRENFSDSKVVFTIHNLAYQGVFPRLDLLLADVGVDESFFEESGKTKRVNMMKAALEGADVITTVSPSYANEIQEEEYGCGLDGLLRRRRKELFGILNGIDTKEWDPDTDPLLKHHYNANNLEGKALLKRELQQRFNLDIDPNVPLISMISRITEQKGFVELLQGSPSTLEQIVGDLPLQFLIIGTGNKEMGEALKALAELHSNLSVNLIFSNEAAHLAEAGSDFFLMPSRYEPCGLNQMYSLRYGTIPIARRTGGLRDSIVDISQPEGTGILFDELSMGEIYGAIERGVTLYQDNYEMFKTIRKRGMGVDFSWLNSAQEYVRIYNKVLKG
ncbi:MAG: glycogen/starch synthase [Sphaerochaetaceae bacterium]|nr:glycogen/starch synthase [Sphaerochaetaceae bacterium]